MTKRFIMDQQYDIYFTGKLVEGVTTEQAKENFARLFKTPAEQLEKLFNGKPQLLKRGLDKTEAIKYKAALHKAGLLVAFKTHGEASPAATPASQADSNTADETQQDTFSIAPVGSDVLTESERQVIEAVDIDTSSLQLMSPFATAATDSEPEPPPPDTQHISLAEPGADMLPDKAEPEAAPVLDLEQLTIAPPGADIETLPDQRQPLNPDTSGLSVAPAGADILPEQKHEPVPEAPNTEHLSIDKE